MALEHILGRIPGVVATGDQSGNQFRVVKMSNTTAGAVKAVATTNDTAIGVLQNKPTDGQAANVAFAGITKIEAGTSVGWAQGVPVGFNTTAQAVPRTTSVGTAPTPKVIGRYLLYETSVASNDYISVALTLGGFGQGT